MRVFTLAALAAFAITGSAFAADSGGSVTFKTAPVGGKIVHDGAIWSCKDADCRAGTVKAMPAARVCRQLAGKAGEITAFTYRGETFDAEALAACNTSAKPAQ